MRAAGIVLPLVLAALVIAGCGEEEQPASDQPRDDVVEVGQATTVTLDGLAYRVMSFRQLNPNISPDRSLYEGPRAREGNGLWSAFARVCNDGSEPRTNSDDVHLENASGERFAPQPDRVADAFRYRQVELDSGRCLPGPDSSAEATWDGVAIVFEVPVRDMRERPIYVAIRSEDGSSRARIQLDV